LDSFIRFLVFLFFHVFFFRFLIGGYVLFMFLYLCTSTGVDDPSEAPEF